MADRIVFVTGKLAEPSLRAVVLPLAEKAGFEAHVEVARISVAALMTTQWLIGKLHPPEGATRVILPGMCKGDPAPLSESLGGIAVERGPVDLRDLPDYFRQPSTGAAEYGGYDIEILAEINHANRLNVEEVLIAAQHYRDSGADIIDLGCTPQEPWAGIESIVRELIARGFRVSIDTFDQNEAAAAARAGAELVLSVHSENCRAAADWGCAVVVIPRRHDQPEWLADLHEAVDLLDQLGVPHRLDPILEPIGFGFADSLQRYWQTRREFPNAAIMMGIGNLTEMTEVDSGGVNALLIGICQELGIRSVLTTEVINWSRTCVREIDIARRMMKHAVERRIVPKRIDPRLVMLRDPRLRPMSEPELRELAARITDPNFRLFADGKQITAINGGQFEQSGDAFELFDKLGVTDPSHAFYLGWEMAKASIANLLGKSYTQDQALKWGFLTWEETSHRDRGKSDGSR